jgi:hypothetical protein
MNNEKKSKVGSDLKLGLQQAIASETETYTEFMDAQTLKKFEFFLELLSPAEINSLWNLYMGTFLRNSIMTARLEGLEYD